MEEHTKKIEMQETVLKDLQRKLEVQDETLKTVERKLEIQDRVSINMKHGHFKDNLLTDNNRTTQMKQTRQSVAEGVAFSVQLSVRQTHIGLQQTIKYDKIHLNDGNGYSVHSGIFTAPQSGVYMFSYILGHGYEPAQAWLELMHNGVKINAAITDTFHNNEDLQGGNFAILRLNAGDSVWVQSWHQNDAYIDGPAGFTSFSGALLY